MSRAGDCLNPDCVTEYRGVMPWMDVEYCSHACRRAHTPRSVTEPDPPLCARRSCGQPAAPRVWLLGGYCSSACEQLDMPAPVEAWAAAMGRSIDGGPIGAVEPDASFPPPVRAVEPLTPVPAGAEPLEGVPLAHRPVEPVTIGGATVYNVHPPFRCEGRPCVIHNPSDHHMADWPKVWRDGKRMVERTCPHGIGHPDPDDLAYRLTMFGPVGERDSGVHGCDGCCQPSDVDEARAALEAHIAAIELTAVPSRVATPPWAPHHRDEPVCVDIERPSRTQPRRWWARLLRRTA